jgi:hypothetical protein
MKPYYQDDLIKIYNTGTNIFKSEVVVLDPPLPLKNATVFKAKCYIIFAGKQYPMYEEQFPKWRVVQVPYRWTVRGETFHVSDMVLVVGNVLAPGPGDYVLKPLPERAGEWDRPVELMINLLTETYGLVLDPFMGGGNSMVACKRLGREGIGFDTDKEQCRIAAERCSKI